nr:reverse transcriptase domain-containing protein [Tanacetum cinerariifolium]
MPDPRFTKVIINHFISNDKTISMRNKINLHTVRDDSLLGTLKFVSKTKDCQKYGALIPNGMINQDIKYSKTYKIYYDFATGKVPPKKVRKFKKPASPKLTTVSASPKEPTMKSKRVKRLAKKFTTTPTAGVVIRDNPGVFVSKKKALYKDDRGKGIELLSDATLLEDAQLKKALKKSSKDESNDVNDDDNGHFYQAQGAYVNLPQHLTPSVGLGIPIYLKEGGMVDSQPMEEKFQGATTRDVGMETHKGPTEPQAKMKATPRKLAYADFDKDALAGSLAKGFSNRLSLKSSGTSDTRRQTRSTVISQKTPSKNKEPTHLRRARRLKDHNTTREKARRERSKSRRNRSEHQETRLDSEYEEGSDDACEDLNLPYKRPKPTPFTQRITCFKYHKREKLPRNQGGAVRNWFDDLDPKTVDSFEELSQKFLKEFSQQKRYAKDPIKIHGIKRRQNEGLQAFRDWFKARAFIRGEVSAGSAEMVRPSQWDKGYIHPAWTRGLERAKNRGGLREARRNMGVYTPYPRKYGFTSLTNTSKEILAMESISFPEPPPLIETIKKQNLNKFCDYHGDRGRETIEEGSGVGIILINLEEKIYSYVILLKFKASNHAMNCEALLTGLAAYANQGMKDLHVFIDSLTLVTQVERNHTPAAEQEKRYKEEIMNATLPFHKFQITHLPKILNLKSEVLTGLATIKLEFLNQEVSVGIKTRPPVEETSSTKKGKATSKALWGKTKLQP